jgi:hypothetical protein
MSRKHRRNSAEWQWEQALIDAYYDYRWHQVLDPLAEQFEQWKADQLTHDDMDQAIHRVHRQNQQLHMLFIERRNQLIQMIQFDRDWFLPWEADHRAPAGVQLLPPSWAAPATEDHRILTTAGTEEGEGLGEG